MSITTIFWEPRTTPVLILEMLLRLLCSTFYSSGPLLTCWWFFWECSLQSWETHSPPGTKWLRWSRLRIIWGLSWITGILETMHLKISPRSNTLCALSQLTSSSLKKRSLRSWTTRSNKSMFRTKTTLTSFRTRLTRTPWSYKVLEKNRMTMPRENLSRFRRRKMQPNIDNN